MKKYIIKELQIIGFALVLGALWGIWLYFSSERKHPYWMYALGAFLISGLLITILRVFFKILDLVFED